MIRNSQILSKCFYTIRTKLQVSRLHVAGCYPFHLQVALTYLECIVLELVSRIWLQVTKFQACPAVRWITGYFQERLNRLLYLARASSLVIFQNEIRPIGSIHTSLEARARDLCPARFARSDIELRGETLCFPLPELATSNQQLVTDEFNH